MKDLEVIALGKAKLNEGVLSYNLWEAVVGVLVGLVIIFLITEFYRGRSRK